MFGTTCFHNRTVLIKQAAKANTWFRVLLWKVEIFAERHWVQTEAALKKSRRFPDLPTENTEKMLRLDETNNQSIDRTLPVQHGLKLIILWRGFFVSQTNQNRVEVCMPKSFCGLISFFYSLGSKCTFQQDNDTKSFFHERFKKPPKRKVFSEHTIS